MRLLKPHAFLLIFALSASTAMSAQDAASPADPTQFRIPVENPDPGAISLTAWGKSYESAIAQLDQAKRIHLSPFPGVCFTMRTYKVKPAERLRDNESGSTGYSTCQMGSNYRVRSADVPAK